ncbi:MAG: S-layer homology domain-containing protein, partial [Defluviitaleaceae bacterium]|nr:S-layer homology domain-containing protein [Defluviitaleaceae bacterium]
FPPAPTPPPVFPPAPPTPTPPVQLPPIHGPPSQGNEGRPGGGQVTQVGRPVNRPVENEEDEQITQAPTRVLHRRENFINGFRDAAFRPENGITRAEIAQIMFNLSNTSTQFVQPFHGFTDVSPQGWYFQAISYFANAGVLVGFGDGTFRPNENITMAQFAQFAVGAFGLTNYNLANPMPGLDNHWSNEAVAIAFDARFTAYLGNNFVFNENSIITRAQAVTFINQYLDRTSSISDIEMYLQSYRNGLPVFTDLDRSHWAFYQIMEASIAHYYFVYLDGSTNWAFPQNAAAHQIYSSIPIFHGWIGILGR